MGVPVGCSPPAPEARWTTRQKTWQWLLPLSSPQGSKAERVERIKAKEREGGGASSVRGAVARPVGVRGDGLRRRRFSAAPERSGAGHDAERKRNQRCLGLTPGPLVGPTSEIPILHPSTITRSDFQPVIIKPDKNDHVHVHVFVLLFPFLSQ